ncbi:hypothetical protein SASPL_154600 [Salvia splendens]|uniref:Uncharacterized protein n=1 Tax=Salvia splendens TaxID=180675 RepID=A0A8X8YYL6_SALSN|nr:hypothetical protein SASPL_154600 [Salvia splendens]
MNKFTLTYFVNNTVLNYISSFLPFIHRMGYIGFLERLYLWNHIMIHGITCHVRPVSRRLRQRIISFTVQYVRALIPMLIEGADNQVLPMEDIAKEIEKKLVGQSVLFKLQFKNQLDTPSLKLGSQEAKRELKLSDLIFCSDLPEVSQKSFVTPDLSSVTNEINHERNIEGSVKRCLEDDFNSCDDIFGSQKNKNKKVSK